MDESIDDDEKVKMVWISGIGVAVFIVALCTGVIVYGFYMRSKASIMNHLKFVQLRKSYRDDASSPSPNKTMSIRSFERTSPEKVYPINPFRAEKMDQPRQGRNHSVDGTGSIMNAVKMQQLDSVEDDEHKYLKQPLHGEAQSNHDDSMAKMNSGGEAAAMLPGAAVAFGSTRDQCENGTPAPAQLGPQQTEEQATYIYSPKEHQGSIQEGTNDMLNGSNGVFPDLAKDGHKGMLP